MRSRHILILSLLAALVPAAPGWAVDDGGEPPPDNPPASTRDEKDGDRGNLVNAAVVSPLESARGHIAAGRYTAALRSLRIAAGAAPGDPDIWNLAGYASRNLGRFGKAEEYYAHALRLDPDHIGALEYQGELFVLTGQKQKALANLARLKQLCGACEEMRELEEAIAATK